MGCFALLWTVSYTGQLTTLFGASGVISAHSVHQWMAGGDPTETALGFSHLLWARENVHLWFLHGGTLLVLSLFTYGAMLKVMAPLALFCVLGYVHRGPMLTGLFEPVLCMLLLYLCISPGSSIPTLRDNSPLGWRACVATRLIQIHLCFFYVMIGFSKLSTSAWRTGEVAWDLSTDAHHSLLPGAVASLDPLLLNAWSHLWLLVELAFPILIWVSALRPIMIVLITICWVCTGLATSQLPYAFLMAIANIAFVPSESVRKWLLVGRPNAISR